MLACTGSVRAAALGLWPGHSHRAHRQLRDAAGGALFPVPGQHIWDDPAHSAAVRWASARLSPQAFHPAYLLLHTSGENHILSRGPLLQGVLRFKLCLAPVPKLWKWQDWVMFKNDKVRAASDVTAYIVLPAVRCPSNPENPPSPTVALCSCIRALLEHFPWKHICKPQFGYSRVLAWQSLELSPLPSG